MLIFQMPFGIEKSIFVPLPYEKDFYEKNISTKARPIQMNSEHLEFCKKEIQTLLDKKISNSIQNLLGVVQHFML